jgi:hypothetical protein
MSSPDRDYTLLGIPDQRNRPSCDTVSGHRHPSNSYSVFGRYISCGTAFKMATWDFTAEAGQWQRTGE